MGHCRILLDDSLVLFPNKGHHDYITKARQLFEFVLLN